MFEHIDNAKKQENDVSKVNQEIISTFLLISSLEDGHEILGKAHNSIFQSQQMDKENKDFLGKKLIDIIINNPNLSNFIDVEFISKIYSNSIEQFENFLKSLNIGKKDTREIVQGKLKDNTEIFLVINQLFEETFKFFEDYVSNDTIATNKLVRRLLIKFADILNDKNNNHFLDRYDKIIEHADRKFERSETLHKLEKIPTFWQKAPYIIADYKAEFNDMNEKDKKDFLNLIKDIKKLIVNQIATEYKKVSATPMTMIIK